jgi:hypothetical protein
MSDSKISEQKTINTDMFVTKLSMFLERYDYSRIMELLDSDNLYSMDLSDMVNPGIISDLIDKLIGWICECDHDKLFDKLLAIPRNFMNNIIVDPTNHNSNNLINLPFINLASVIVDVLHRNAKHYFRNGCSKLNLRVTQQIWQSQNVLGYEIELHEIGNDAMRTVVINAAPYRKPVKKSYNEFVKWMLTLENPDRPYDIFGDWDVINSVIFHYLTDGLDVLLHRFTMSDFIRLMLQTPSGEFYICRQLDMIMRHDEKLCDNFIEELYKHDNFNNVIRMYVVVHDIKTIKHLRYVLEHPLIKNYFTNLHIQNNILFTNCLVETRRFLIKHVAKQSSYDWRHVDGYAEYEEYLMCMATGYVAIKKLFPKKDWLFDANVYGVIWNYMVFE